MRRQDAILRDGHFVASSEYDPKCTQHFRGLSKRLKMSLFSSWPGKSAKRVFALGDPAIHVFLAAAAIRTWMPGTRPGMTSFALMPHFLGCILSQTLRTRADYKSTTT